MKSTKVIGYALIIAAILIVVGLGITLVKNVDLYEDLTNEPVEAVPADSIAVQSISVDSDGAETANDTLTVN